MNIVYCINNNKNYLDMMLKSMASFYNFNKNISFYIIVNSEEQIYNELIKINQVKDIIYNKLNITFRERLNSHEGPTDRLKNTSYLKLWIPELLKDKIDKCLFVDCDCLCFGNIEDEYNQVYQNKLALPLIHVKQQRKEELGVSKYFSTGLMLFDFAKDWTNWRENLLSSIDKIKTSFWCHEETLINFGEKNISELPESLQGYDFSLTPFKYISGKKIIHFGGKNKINFYNAYNYLFQK